MTVLKRHIHFLARLQLDVTRALALKARTLLRTAFQNGCKLDMRLSLEPTILEHHRNMLPKCGNIQRNRFEKGKRLVRFWIF